MCTVQIQTTVSCCVEFFLLLHVCAVRFYRRKMAWCFRCKICRLIFKDRWRMCRHLWSHHFQAYYNCTHCNYVCSNYWRLKRHITIIHNDDVSPSRLPTTVLKPPPGWKLGMPIYLTDDYEHVNVPEPDGISQPHKTKRNRRPVSGRFDRSEIVFTVTSQSAPNAAKMSPPRLDLDSANISLKRPRVCLERLDLASSAIYRYGSENSYSRISPSATAESSVHLPTSIGEFKIIVSSFAASLSALHDVKDGLLVHLYMCFWCSSPILKVL